MTVLLKSYDNTPGIRYDGQICDSFSACDYKFTFCGRQINAGPSCAYGTVTTKDYNNISAGNILHFTFGEQLTEGSTIITNPYTIPITGPWPVSC